MLTVGLAKNMRYWVFPPPGQWVQTIHHLLSIIESARPQVVTQREDAHLGVVRRTNPATARLADFPTAMHSPRAMRTYHSTFLVVDD